MRREQKGTEQEIKARRKQSPCLLSDNDKHNEDPLRLSLISSSCAFFFGFATMLTMLDIRTHSHEEQKTHIHTNTLSHTHTNTETCPIWTLSNSTVPAA